MRTLYRLAKRAGPAAGERARAGGEGAGPARPRGIAGVPRRWLAGACLAGTLLVAAGCGRSPEHRVLGYRQSPGTAQAPTDPAERDRVMRGSNTLEGRNLSDELMVASEGVLGDAHVLDNKHLYARLGPKADVDTVPDLIRALVLVMHQRFPNEDIIVHLSDPEGKPMLDASLDVASKTVTYSLPPQHPAAP